MYFLVTGVLLCGGLLFTVGRLALAGDRASRRPAVVAFVLTLPLAGFSVVFAWAGIYENVRCDETCYGPGWWNSMDSWQWIGQLGVAFAGFLALLVATWLFARRSYWRSWSAIIVAAIAYGLWAVLLAPLTGDY